MNPVLAALSRLTKTLPTLPTPLRIASFLVLLLSLWVPIATPLYFNVGDDNLRTIGVMGILFLLFMGLLIPWSHWVYGYPLSWRAYGVYGLGRQRRQAIELLQGVALGFGFTVSLFLVSALLGWVQLTPSTGKLFKTFIEGSVTGLGVAFAEEIFFRGWLLTELEQGYPRRTALWTNGLIFAVLHFLKPLPEILRTLPQFPALTLLGLSLVMTKRRHGDRLGSAIGLHGGLVWAYYVLNVGKLVDYPNTVPEWITGIDRNPLSGLLGISFLVLLLCWVSRPSPKIRRSP